MKQAWSALGALSLLALAVLVAGCGSGTNAVDPGDTNDPLVEAQAVGTITPGAGGTVSIAKARRFPLLNAPAPSWPEAACLAACSGSVRPLRTSHLGRRALARRSTKSTVSTVSSRTPVTSLSLVYATGCYAMRLETTLCYSGAGRGGVEDRLTRPAPLPLGGLDRCGRRGGGSVLGREGLGPAPFSSEGTGAYIAAQGRRRESARAA